MMQNVYIGTSKFKKHTEPVVGYKRAQLRVVSNYAGGAFRAYLAPIQGPLKTAKIEFNAASECPSYKSHKGKPSVFCDCGFYSYRELDDALSHCPSHSYLLFKTVASGKILMYAKGVRAGNQRVEEVIVPGCCHANCPMSADRIFIPSLNMTKANIVGMCKFHGKDKPAKTFSWLEDIINSGLKNGEPPISVRSINPDIIPWDGMPEYKTFTPKQEPVLSSVSKAAILGAGSIIGLRFLLDTLERKPRI